MLLNRVLPLTAVLALAVAGCAAPADDDGSPRVVTALYPLQFLAAEVAGDRARVESIIPQAAEPHDVELAPAQVRRLGEADLVVFIAGFQPALDDAIAQRPPAVVIDAASELGLDLFGPGATGHDDDHDDGDAHDGEAHDKASGAHDHSGHDHSGDPHFWLDPTLLAALAEPVAAELSALDPDGAETYQTNAARLRAELDEIDDAYATTLATCERDVIVVSHEAFGFLAERYGLTQVGMSGLDPEGEPSPARLREIRDVVGEHDVTTIFTEALLNPKAAEVLAADLGLTTALLDPIEAQVDPEADYRDVMRANLENLATALDCS